MYWYWDIAFSLKISMAWFSNWTQKHYIQNIENLNIWKNLWKSPKNPMEIAWIFWGSFLMVGKWVLIFTGNYVPKVYLMNLKCLECNGNYVDFLVVFTSVFKCLNFQCFECNVFAFSLKITPWELRKSSWCNE